MKNICVIVFLSVTIFTNAQSDFKKFLRLSKPLKGWVLLHPLKAKLALEITEKVIKVTDSIQKTNLLDGDVAGGQVDAFRHAYWMASLRQNIGISASKSLGRAQEKDNYRSFKKRKSEEGVLPDQIASEMDLFNNAVGLALAFKKIRISEKELIRKVIDAIKKGKMKIIKKDKKGSFLTCKGALIDAAELKGKWRNNKCLVFSNAVF
jgi:hypothetical protein